MIGRWGPIAGSRVKKGVQTAEVPHTVPAMTTPHPHYSRRAGISLLAILLSLCAMAVLSLLAIPHFFSRPSVTLWHAVELLSRDLRSAQNRAAFYKAPAVFRFEAHGWEATGSDGRPLGTVHGESKIERGFDDIFEGVEIVRIDFGDDDALEFDAAGRAGEAGEVEVSFGGQTYTVRVEEGSGLTTVLGPDGVLKGDDRRVMLDPAERP
jgi:hypothetical protein